MVLLPRGRGDDVCGAGGGTWGRAWYVGRDVRCGGDGPLRWCLGCACVVPGVGCARGGGGWGGGNVGERSGVFETVARTLGSGGGCETDEGLGAARGVVGDWVGGGLANERRGSDVWGAWVGRLVCCALLFFSWGFVLESVRRGVFLYGAYVISYLLPLGEDEMG